MLTMSDRKTTVKDSGKKTGSSWIKNVYLNNRVNEEAIGIALTSVFQFERVFKLISSLVTNIVTAKCSSIMSLPIK